MRKVSTVSRTAWSASLVPLWREIQLKHIIPNQMNEALQMLAEAPDTLSADGKPLILSVAWDWFDARREVVNIVHIPSLTEYCHDPLLTFNRIPALFFPNLKDLHLSTPGYPHAIGMIPRFLSPFLQTLHLRINYIPPSALTLNAPKLEAAVLSVVKAVGTLPEISNLSLVCGDSVHPLVSMDWFHAFLEAHPSREKIVRLEIRGSQLKPEIISYSTTLPYLKMLKLRRNRATVNDHHPGEPASKFTTKALAIYNAKTLKKLDIELDSQHESLDMRSIGRFVALTKLVLVVQGLTMPQHILCLVAIQEIRHLELVLPEALVKFGADALHAFVEVWEGLRVFVVRDANIQSTHPASSVTIPILKLEDLRCLSRHCPDIRFISIAVNCNTQQGQFPTPAHKLPHGAVLDLSGTYMNAGSSARVLEYLKLWAPKLERFRGGQKDTAWQLIHQFYRGHAHWNMYSPITTKPLPWDARDWGP